MRFRRPPAWPEIPRQTPRTAGRDPDHNTGHPERKGHPPDGGDVLYAPGARYYGPGHGRLSGASAWEFPAKREVDENAWIGHARLGALVRPGCSRCAEQGPTCCVLTPGNEDLCFPVSTIERLRIEEHIGPTGEPSPWSPIPLPFGIRCTACFPMTGRRWNACSLKWQPCALELRQGRALRVFAPVRLPLAKAGATVLLPPLPVVGHG